MLKRLYVISAEIKNKIPHPHKLIDKHYVLEYKEENVIVFTKRPLNEYKSYLISNTTINGKEKNQYMTGIVYKIDKSNTLLSQAPETKEYYMKNLTAITRVKQEAHTFPLIELAELISQTK